MKAILMSIKAQHNRNIEARKKTSELRKRVPECEYPIKVYTYESGYDGRNKVVNEWICKDVTEWRICMGVPAHLPKVACVSIADILEYSEKNYDNISEMKISELKVYDEPKELSEFKKPCPIKKKDCNNCEFYSDYSGSCTNWVTRPPQSWCYVEEIKE